MARVSIWNLKSWSIELEKWWFLLFVCVNMIWDAWSWRLGVTATCWGRAARFFSLINHQRGLVNAVNVGYLLHLQTVKSLYMLEASCSILGKSIFPVVNTTRFSVDKLAPRHSRLLRLHLPSFRCTQYLKKVKNGNRNIFWNPRRILSCGNEGANETAEEFSWAINYIPGCW